MFVDASVIVAILADEADSQELRLKLKRHRKRLVSAIAAYEAVMAIRRIRNISASDALRIVDEFIHIYAIKEIGIEPRFKTLAIEAFDRFGKGQGHRAALNMGDCFAYACARIHRVPLLCKGDDFIHTDIALV